MELSLQVQKNGEVANLQLSLTKKGWVSRDNGHHRYDVLGSVEGQLIGLIFDGKGEGAPFQRVRDARRTEHERLETVFKPEPFSLAKLQIQEMLSAGASMFVLGEIID